MDVLVTYDIRTATQEGQLRLARVAHVCQQFGTRVQYSVFECRLSPAAFERMLVTLKREMNLTEDSVIIYRFDGPITDSRMTLGGMRVRDPAEPWII